MELSIRLLNRFNSSSDSRKFPLLFSFVERGSLEVDGREDPFCLVGVTDMTVGYFFVDSIVNEMDEHESV